MDVEQLTGRYRRLKEELAEAYGEQPWPAGRIDRLAQEIADTERAIAGYASAGSALAGDATASDAAPDHAPTAPAAASARVKAITVPRNPLTPFGRREPEHAAGE